VNYPSIRIEGAILSPDILSQIEELPGQKPSDFGLDSGTKVKDEIARAWADAQDYWRIFQRKLESVKPGSNATTETRNLWMVPLLGLLRYDLEYQPRGSELNGRIYAISHRVTNRAGASVQIVGYRDPAGLDKKPANAARRMSAHAMVQEFLNLDDQLYGLVADGHVLRLLRDSSRLVKLSYLEFDLDRIFTDGLYADFAVLYRLLHATRLPLTDVSAAESLIERYHQDSLDSGARIRAGLSKAVEHAILDFGNGFVAHAENEVLRASIFDGSLSADAFYQQLLRLIYRLLFLMVIEERGLVFPQDVSKAKRDVYRNYYSVARLRRLSEKKYLADPRRNDLWQGLQASFSLFEADGRGQELGIAPLAGDLFSQAATNALEGCTLGNDVLLGCLCALGLYRHPDSGQIIRVNYAALNVEEFGSVYEGLLEFEPEFISEGLNVRFAFRQGEARAATGSHYTPDELVQPLIRHSLDCLIAERLKTDDPEAALLDLRVADIACGSGHILLAAARRIATELATVRTGEEQPSPSAYRTALRDAIRTCIYGVDLNPLAVELCKVALWLEAHIPGQPLYFLDHHIKCGNAIVGFARREEVGRSIPTEAFNALAGDDKGVASTFRKKNKEDLKHHQQTSMEFTPQLRGHFVAVLDEWRLLSALPELTPAQIKDKKKRFGAFVNGTNADLLRTIADVPVAQFFLSKTTANEGLLVTDAEFRGWWRGERAPRGAGALAAKSTGKQKRFFHWFLEFPQIIEKGGFDCILGNPPYLGGKKISGTHGATLLDYLKATYSNTGGLCDLVTYFLRRAAQLLNRNGYLGLITTNSLSEGDTRTGGLQQLLENGAEIRFAVSSMRWPGTASLQVSLVAMSMVPNSKPRLLNGREVEHISSMFDADVEMPDPIRLQCMAKRSFVGTIVSGKGFVLSPEEATEVASIGKNGDVIRTYLSGSDLTSSPTLAPSRYVIDFGDRTRSEAEKYLEPFAIVEERVYPERKSVKKKVYRDNWWRFAEPQTRLYAAISKLDRVIAIPQTAKWLTVSFVPRGPGLCLRGCNNRL
jgi:methylase of polypeptide subunit release factors